MSRGDHTVKRGTKAFTLIELLVVIAIIALLISILLPSLSRARELSKRLVCASNIKGFGTSGKIYANDNNEKWMTPPFKNSVINDQGVDYLLNDEESTGIPATDQGEVGYLREKESTSEARQQGSTSPGSSELSVTRAFWMLVRSGNITVDQYLCPSSGDDKDKTENLDLYYDFEHYENISYGYQVPFGPKSTRAREGMDNRQIIAADKGPLYFEHDQLDWSTPDGRLLTTDDSPKLWREYNSDNHGGNNNGEGQNCLFADGHASFKRQPAVGIDSDNIYTLIVDQWGTVEGFNRIHGESPHLSAAPNPYPGQDAFGVGANEYAATDTLIYP